MYDVVVVGLGGVGTFALRSLVKSALKQTGTSRTGSAGPQKLLGIERYRMGAHGYGSSHGRTRIYRRAYFEHPSYVPWIDHSINVFRELEECAAAVCGGGHQHPNANNKNGTAKLMNECGLLTVAPAASMSSSFSGTTASSSTSSSSSLLPEILRNTLLASEMYDIPVEVLNNTELRERYPQLQYDGNPNENIEMIGTFEPSAGFVRPELILEAARNDILQYCKSSDGNSKNDNENNGVDVTVLENTEVLSYKTVQGSSSDDVVTIRIKRNMVDDIYDENNNQQHERGRTGSERKNQMTVEEVRTRCLLISAGAWSSTSLLPQSWRKYLTVTRQIQCWVDVASDLPAQRRNRLDLDMYSPEKLPCWFMETPWDDPIHRYGFPYDTSENDRIADNIDAEAKYWIKIASHDSVYPVYDPSTNSNTPVSSIEMRQLHHMIRTSLSEFGKASCNDDNDSTTTKNITCHTQPCMYTMTPDGHFMIGSPSNNVFVVAGLSGHGFKMLPALGQIMADYARQDYHALRQWNFDFCSPKRFGG